MKKKIKEKAYVHLTRNETDTSVRGNREAEGGTKERWKFVLRYL